MTKFNQCPNCKEKCWRYAFKTIHECRKCKTLYCYECGDERCPNCGSKERTEAGKCYKA